MTKKNSPDYTLIIATTVLIIFGILTLSSVSATVSQEKFGNPFYFILRQNLIGLLLGIILAFLFFKMKLSFLKKISPVLLLVNLIFMVLVFVPGIGISSGGATRWINLKIFSFQPAEFLKISFFIYLAALLESKKRKNQKETHACHSFKRNLIKSSKESKLGTEELIIFIILIIIIGLFLIIQPNVSTFGVITFVAVIMYFASGTPLWHSFLIVGSLFGFFLIFMKTAAYRISRLEVFLNPELDPLGKGYQIKQSLIAIGSGGILGLGLGMSRQKFGFLPESTSDTIFAILTEEMGFLGAFIVITFFLIFLWRGVKIAKNASEPFSQLLAIGISSWICLQAFINIGSSIRFLPLTGIPLPFITYGMSHLVAELIGVGILLKISKEKT